MLAQARQDRLSAFCRSHGIRRAALFGSLARGEGRSDSDIDLLVTFDAPKSLLSVVRLERELGKELGRKVELLTEEAISPHIRRRIAPDLTVIYES
ncbi:MAG TPA: nucleotidyltransferase family protein [Candidatus Methanoperedens sp.]|nr:nucleotidyltransferase family protein [Candidatus Methanoperedens sp.]